MKAKVNEIPIIQKNATTPCDIASIRNANPIIRNNEIIKTQKKANTLMNKVFLFI